MQPSVESADYPGMTLLELTTRPRGLGRAWMLVGVSVFGAAGPLGCADDPPDGQAQGTSDGLSEQQAIDECEEAWREIECRQPVTFPVFKRRPIIAASIDEWIVELPGGFYIQPFELDPSVELYGDIVVDNDECFVGCELLAPGWPQCGGDAGHYIGPTNEETCRDFLAALPDGG
ncbi:MAG: hypothetical protein AB1Z98_34740 [Nannocystaceae bacterium]